MRDRALPTLSAGFFALSAFGLLEREEGLGSKDGGAQAIGLQFGAE